MSPTTEVNIAPDLSGLVVPITSIQPHPQNPRRGDLEAIGSSVDRFGQIRPVLVQKSTGYICAGNHLWKALMERGWDRIARVEVDLSDDDALAYVVADNRTAELGGYDQQALGGILESLMTKGQLSGTGYDAEQVDDFLAAIDELPTTEAEFEGDHRESAEETASRYREPSQVVPQRQFIIMIPETEAAEFEGYIKVLKKAWGVDEFRGIVREALGRCAKACGQDEDIVCTCLQVVEPSPKSPEA